MAPAMSDTQLFASSVLHYLSPVTVGLYYFFAVAFASPTCGNETNNKKKRRTASRLLLAVTLTFVGETAACILSGFMDQEWAPQHTMIHNLTSVLIWGCMTNSLSDSECPVWHACLNTWTIGATLDLILFGLAVGPQSDSTAASISIHLIRLVLLALLLSSTVLSHTSDDQEKETGEDKQPLDQDSSSDSSSEDDSDDEDDEALQMMRKKMQEQGRLGYIRGFSIFLNHMRPNGNRRVQLWIAGLGLSIIAERFLAVFIPRQLGIITDALSEINETGYFPWSELISWALLEIIRVSAGMDLLKTMATNRIAGHAYKQLTSAALRQVMSLSMDYHTTKSTGNVLKAIEQGADINPFLDVFCLGAPVLIDLVVASLYLSWVFNDAYMALIILATCFIYIYMGVHGSKSQNAYRREQNKKGRRQNEILYDSVSNWQTISYHNQQQFEQDRHFNAVEDSVEAEARYCDSTLYSDAAQSFIMVLGLLSACFMAAYRISTGTAPVGHLVLLITYWTYIESPLGQLTYTYRYAASQFVSAERLLELLQTKPSVQDKADAKELQVAEARVDFTNVSFAYTARKPTLKDVTVTAHPGQTIALVGETGGGKSTLLKLLMRFYDTTAGAITIDGQDIRDVTLSSLRDAFGVVPQDPSLFNDTILNNIRYSRLDATVDDVHAACKAAAIHDKIMSFPDAYASKVGERGVRLSGGELQRVAIARLLLKKPSIVLLDEATSAVDSSTEAQIQDAFRMLSQGRTTFVIAHRLSTVMDADVILVIVDGRVVEQGAHAELLEKGGEYAKLWSKQVSKKEVGVTAAKVLE